ncbi:hypothetical protein N658DRAFT_244234 [Parathielavia hyrcaniae]|uniref:Uncharacterized protein n=1 Tax=Parathielavia hyrcaniae TaxID=113614 RepID=A0AAN6QBE9_9PEZI|nr:hypothetical protein N658DRAFT_244234 [Parathielavia hyrcaniae]
MCRQRPSKPKGWAFWHAHGPSGNKLVAAGRLEKKGPFGDDSIQTSNRAELRAIIAALGFRPVRGSTRWSSPPIPSMRSRATPHGPRRGSRMAGKRARGLTSRIGICGKRCWVRLNDIKARGWLSSSGESQENGTPLLMQLRRRLPPREMHLTGEKSRG